MSGHGISNDENLNLNTKSHFMTTNTDNNISIIGREEPSELMHYTIALFLNDSEEIE
jgi:hypothetical protein